jgi:adenine-specific DNA methylase
LTFPDLYNDRELLAILTFSRLVKALTSETSLAVPVRTCLALAVDRLVYQGTALSRWDSSRSTIKGAFSKQALQVVWDYAEANPFSGATADWSGAVEWVAKVIEANQVIEVEGAVSRNSATTQILPDDSVDALITDPPYFSAIPYADLSDFYYVWLRKMLHDDFPELFESMMSEKDEELIVTNSEPTSDGGKKDSAFFTKGMTQALDAARQAVRPSGIATVVYAEGTTAGWEAIVQAILDAGWIVTSSWPIDSEMETRTQAQGAASLQSSVHIVCRPREEPDGSLRTDDIGDWRDVLSELPGRMHEWMPRLAEEGIVGADAIFACLGPALEIFSRYSRVEKASGKEVALSEYLEEVWSAISHEALSMIFRGADASGFEEDARLTAMWLWTLHTSGGQPADQDVEGTRVGGYSLEYDAARKIAQGLGAHLENLNKLVEVKGDTATLLSADARMQFLFGNDAAETTLGGRKKPQQMALQLEDEIEPLDEEGRDWVGVSTLGTSVLDQLHQAMILFGLNRGEALRRFLVEDGVGNNSHFWRLAQALSALYAAGTNEKRWVDGVLGRKKSLGL